ncbi:hypothetical protein AVL62_12550 [Serinicoccus chungangensis]|uniref:Gram-positive cocci surface proteins LPxTG domain-containing protein n=1 Tax=Serinicoccus chungangensis TaxID=767452 RepID=A0A0W8I0C3_9MICO|nr:hypothetical protein [Serinicoccus chungangensis]KUG51076.1 hypothetical protein AVL62_12550 [Serinicoccus chungangensis]
MRTTTLRTLTVAAGAAALTALAAGPALAVDEDQLADTYDNVRCDVMAMPGTATATYLDEATHGPYLEGGNEWVALTLTSDDSTVEVANPGYGETYSSEGGAVIREITLCQGTAAAEEEAPAPEEESDGGAAAEDQAAEDETAAGDDEATAGSDDAAAGDDPAEEDVQAAGPAVETDGPLRETGLSPLLVGGAVLAVAGAGAAAVGLRRQPRGDQG